MRVDQDRDHTSSSKGALYEDETQLNRVDIKIKLEEGFDIWLNTFKESHHFTGLNKGMMIMKNISVMPLWMKTTISG